MIHRILQIGFFSFVFVIFVFFLSSVDNSKLFLTSAPTSDNKGLHGLARLYKLITNAGGKTMIIHSDYRMLRTEQETNNSTDNILFLSLPAAIPANQQELDTLVSWVAKGNHIVAMLALDDAPHWSNKQNRFTIDAFLAAFDLQLTRLDTGVATEEASNKQPYLITQLLHPVTNRIKRVKTGVTSQDHVWQLSGISTPHSSLILLREEASLSPVAWLSLFGKGKVYIFTHSDLFANANIETPDNMQLAKNIIDYSLGKTANIYFDDVHHIASVSTNSIQPSLHLQLLLLAGLLVYMLLYHILNRRLKQGSINNSSLNLFVRHNGLQLSRSLGRTEAAIRYATIFFNRARNRLDLPANSQPLWDELKQQKLNKRLLRKSQKTYQNALSLKRINLNKFIRRLEKLRSQLK